MARKPRPTVMWRYEIHGSDLNSTHQEHGPVDRRTVEMMREHVAKYDPGATLRVFQAKIIWAELDPVSLAPLEGDRG
jgi:hypothetical protein